MNSIISTIIVALVIGFVLGTLLGLFKRIFYVKTDPRVQEARSCLSGANCGGCGYAGCDAYAKAVVEGNAPLNGCVAGGQSVSEALAKIMGVSAQTAEPKLAFLACNGTKECALPKGNYTGIKTCAAAQLTMNGTKKCAFGCIGFGDCVEVCQFDAIKIGADGLPKVNRKLCVGCGSCVKVCPKHLLSLVPANTKGAIAKCSSHSDNKPQIRKDCANGCFKCGICGKKCPAGAIDLTSGIPQIDYTKCTSCGECVNACPDKVLSLFQDIK